MSSKYDKTFLDHLCDYEQGWRVLFTFSVGFLGLSLLWVFRIEPGTATYVVSVMNLFGLSGLALLSGFILSKCN